MRRIAVGDIMTRNFVSAAPNSTLHECAKIMAKESINSLLITSNKKLVGILTARDILKAITKNKSLGLKKTKGIEIATKKIAVIKPSADISDALEKMRASGFRRLPVLSKGEIIGVVTLKDILAIEPTLYGELRTLTDEIREEERKLLHVHSNANRPVEGLCENCGALADLLKVNGLLLCPDCREEMY
ncbi:CBS domain-containing protein [Candidatus Pacearchaeota archaeon]|nr:CBS domain-containing protein [Candidatus Pacearchaeota archaeon]